MFKYMKLQYIWLFNIISLGSLFVNFSFSFFYKSCIPLKHVFCDTVYVKFNSRCQKLCL